MATKFSVVFFYVPNNSTTMKILLRRTLVRFVLYSPLGDGGSEPRSE